MQALNQKKLWDKKHSRGEHAAYAEKPMKFADEAEKYFPSHSYVLELGCGVGADANYFASKGHHVEATDFSSVVIAQNNQRPHENVNFNVVDISEVFPYKDASFDVVYAHLSIHYFNDQITRQIISEVSRVLKPAGMFYFRCKATDSWEKNISVETEPNLFVANETGHIRHLFSEEYTREILNNLFTIKKLSRTKEEYRGQTSKFIDCWSARKKD